MIELSHQQETIIIPVDSDTNSGELNKLISDKENVSFLMVDYESGLVEILDNMLTTNPIETYILVDDTITDAIVETGNHVTDVVAKMRSRFPETVFSFFVWIIR